VLTVGVIGCGYWGPNLIRNFINLKDARVKICSDLDERRLAHMKQLYPSLLTTTDYREVIRDGDVEAVVIATPVSTHFAIAREALDAGKHVFCEKPLTDSVSDGVALIDLADDRGLVLMVGHTFVFTAAVNKIKELINGGELGDVYYLSTARVNLGLFQEDINVVWDLAPHDISIMDHIINHKAESITATGSDHLGNGLEDVAYVTVFYPDNIIGHIHVNWLSPVKIRQTQISGSKKMIVWDDNSPSEKVKVYDKGIEVVKTTDQIYDTLIQYRTGDMHCPKIPQTEALALETEHFADCIEKGIKPISDGSAGWRVVQMLENAENSIKQRGKEIKL